MFNEAPPLLVRVTDCAALLVPTCWLAKVRLVVERLTAGTLEAVPVPVRLTVCGLSLALSVTVIAPVRVPVAVGVRVTLILQLAPAATALPQVLLWL